MKRKDGISAKLRQMEIGQTLTFDLPNAGAIESGKTIAYRLQNMLQCQFTAVSDYANNRLTITKSARP